jgi:hypothetical protein
VRAWLSGVVRKIAGQPLGQDRRIVMGRHLGVCPIDLRLVEAGFDHGDLSVVRHNSGLLGDSSDDLPDTEFLGELPDGSA